MKELLKLLGVLLLLQGWGTVVNTVLGWWRWAHDLLLVNHIGFLDGYEVFAGVVLGLIGLFLYTAAGKRA
ncbi:hypothetical protein [Planomonospora venezuelensis]|uniref:Uncharacterized protein n=1 Tax=Planomonospora venezuelensis TaxID=1999 RepID=A0A841CY84_PLAVE|nr:hypothetical protein [Planomonospora venezuelensis]MBB5961763.1 hypothetical protein [Planomonospora venezuelensis]GIM98911.1 hypothetical protein Pve01_05700 [Planomonospora venezuelensis]